VGGSFWFLTSVGKLALGLLRRTPTPEEVGTPGGEGVTTGIVRPGLRKGGCGFLSMDVEFFLGEGADWRVPLSGRKGPFRGGGKVYLKQSTALLRLRPWGNRKGGKTYFSPGWVWGFFWGGKVVLIEVESLFLHF